MLNNKLSSLIPSQLPGYIREEYPTFVKFLETYYEYLELEKNPQDIISNLRQYTDIDNTLDEFVDVFHDQYLSTLPKSMAVDRRLLAKHIQDLYKIKGTEKSYQLLFRILFNEDVELYYPKTNILKASDGKWVQDRSIRVKPVSGDVFSLVGSAITAQNTTGSVSTIVVDVKAIPDTELYEVFISNNYRGDFLVGDMVISTGFVGEITPTINAYSIFKPGEGFRLGQIFQIASGGGTGTYVKVTRLTVDGGVAGLSLMSFGNGYVSDFYASLNNAEVLADPASPYDQFTNGFVESGFITKADYFSADFAAPDFAAQVIAQFGGNTYVPDNTTFNDDTSCVVYMRMGAVAKYPGYYKTTDGFLSNVNALQDSNYYQDYSYVIKSKRRLEEYKSFVKEILHPAGMKMFGEYQIVNELELGDFLEYDKVVLKMLEEADYIGAVDALSIITGKSRTDTVSTTETVAKTFGKSMPGDLASADDDVFLTTGKAFADLTYQSDGVIFDVEKVIADIVTTSDNLISTTGNGLLDSTGATDANSKTVGKVLVDTPVAVDDTSKVVGKVLVDATTTTEIVAKTTGKNFADTVSVSDVFNTTSGNGASDTIIIDEELTLNIDKPLSELVTQDDSGIITLSDYADDFSQADYSGTTIGTF